MSAGLVEVARQTHEEIERYEVALADLLLKPVASHKDKLRQKHQVSDVLDRITSRHQYLCAFYDPANTDRADELNAISAQKDEDDIFSEFDARLGRIRAYHDKYPSAPPDTAFVLNFDQLERGGSSSAAGVDGSAVGAAAAAAAGLDFLDRMFSGEEAAGKFLDLYPSHTAYNNLKGIRRVTYLKFIDDFDKLLPFDPAQAQDADPDARIPLEAKRTDAYREYLQGLQAYLLGFLRKTQPLLDVDAIERRIQEESEEAWEKGTARGWEDRGESLYGKGKGKGKANAEPAGEGIWCEACARSFAKSTVYEAHLKAPKHAKAAARIASGAAQPIPQPGSSTSSDAAQPPAALNAEQERRLARAKQLAQLEHAVVVLGTELGPLREETKSNVERKSALTEQERQAEAEAAALEAELGPKSEGGGKKKAANGAEGTGEDDDEDGEDDDKIYNPLKLPLGWDGKPIPYWLYKLHGLGVEFKCEICSDHVYQGRKNFEKHFQESRHAFGMRALGLPNTKHFHEITRISDALALAERLKKQGRQLAEEQGEAEEVEDEYGNTYTKKTYELLKRQGLI
ncbi:Pre-mRNA-splicing factor sap61 [Tilletia horrida]|nr:Pre-mRNA-splicing factor sap61 [Tilletia horrida]